MSSVRQLCSRELLPDARMPAELISSEGVARRLLHCLRERRLDMGEVDKVFASQWLSESEVVVGTKCNKLYVVELSSGKRLEVPSLRSKASEPSKSTCGIHSISISPDRKHLAAGAVNPNEVALYKLPDVAPLAVGITHTDWIFDMRWISDSLLITGSRDSFMSLWSITSIEQSEEKYVAEEVPSLEPIFKFSNITTNTDEECRLAGEKVRSLAYNRHQYELGSLQSNPCRATAYFWDCYVFQQVGKMEMPFCAENVCMELDEEGTQLYAVGSRSHVTLIDSRQRHKSAGTINSIDTDCGVRSLQFNSHLLSIGTGAGHLYFYDLRARQYLGHDKCGCQGNDRKRAACSLSSSTGWLRRDHTYRDFFSGLPDPPNAIYTHCYSPLRTKIFTAGGPLPLGLAGNYSAVWQ